MSLFIISLNLIIFAHADILPQPHSQLGDIDQAYLNKEGFLLQTFNNDFLGGTDKYLTNSTGIHYFWFDHNIGREFSFFNKLYTPALSSEFSAPKFSPPLGILANQVSLRTSWGLDYQQWEAFPELSVLFIGNRNVKNTYNSIHRIIGSQLNFDEYGEGKTGNYIAPGLKIVRNLNLVWFGAGYYNSPLMEDLYFEVGTKFSNQTMSGSFQIKQVQQLSSQFYQNIRPDRIHFQLGFSFGKYSAYVVYSTAFLKEDSMRQIHISPLNFSW